MPIQRKSRLAMGGFTSHVVFFEIGVGAFKRSEFYFPRQSAQEPVPALHEFSKREFTT